MRILEADLQSHITAVLMNVKHAVEDARTQGLIAELPEEVSFEVEVITAYQSLNSTTTTTDAETSTNSENRGGGNVVRVEGASYENTNEGGRTISVSETESTDQNTSINTQMDGDNETTVSYNYD